MRNVDERDVAQGGGGSSARPMLAKDRGGFIDRHDLWDEEQFALAGQMRRVIDELGIVMVRFAFVDQHGILRGKTLTRDAVATAMRSGVTAPSSLMLKDTSGHTVFPVFGGDTGLGVAGFAGVGDIVLIPDPRTFRVVPWANATASIICDVYFPDGRPVPFCSRGILKRSLDALADRGLSMCVGAELEFHVYRRDQDGLAPDNVGQPGQPGTGLEVGNLTPGAQLLHEETLAGLDPLVQELYSGLTLLDLPLRSIELEFGPNQFELTMEAQSAAATADAVTMCRTAVRQIAAKMGYVATFMARPQGAAVASTGWHLHQSLTDLASGDNVFIPERDDAPLSAIGQSYLEGLLQHARAATAFATPTVNGYKRYQAYSLAPDRVAWAIDNKGAMARVVGGQGNSATRIENRTGEPAANPYLYIASQAVSGLDGIARRLDLRAPTEDPYGAEDAQSLPRTLGEALGELSADDVFRTALGDEVIDWYTEIKRSEFDRYLRHVSDWEQREYFGLV